MIDKSQLVMKEKPFFFRGQGSAQQLAAPEHARRGIMACGKLKKQSNSALAPGQDQATDLCISSEGYLAFWTCYSQSRAEVTCSVSHEPHWQNTADPASLSVLDRVHGSFSSDGRKSTTTFNDSISPALCMMMMPKPTSAPQRERVVLLVSSLPWAACQHIPLQESSTQVAIPTG